MLRVKKKTRVHCNPVLQKYAGFVPLQEAQIEKRKAIESSSAKAALPCKYIPGSVNFSLMIQEK
ncbi:MAG: hypothetical protein ABI416_18015 [Ginsengibacter sp.]